MRTLKDARTQRGWSQHKLAIELGTTVTTVSRWETGITEVPEIARRFAAHLLGYKPTSIDWDRPRRERQDRAKHPPVDETRPRPHSRDDN